MNSFKQFSVVKITSLHSAVKPTSSPRGAVPSKGDTATVVEVYTAPSISYELECIDENGDTKWVATFEPSAATFELIFELDKSAF